MKSFPSFEADGISLICWCADAMMNTLQREATTIETWPSTNLVRIVSRSKPNRQNRREKTNFMRMKVCYLWHLVVSTSMTSHIWENQFRTVCARAGAKGHHLSFLTSPNARPFNFLSTPHLQQPRHNTQTHCPLWRSLGFNDKANRASPYNWTLNNSGSTWGWVGVELGLIGMRFEQRL